MSTIDAESASFGALGREGVSDILPIVRHLGNGGSAILALALVISGCSTSHRVSAGPLGGVWHVHTNYLTVRSGSGDFSWPVHEFCGAGIPPPCDTLSSTGEIGDGGHAHLTLSSRAGAVAAGTVSGSSEPSVVPNGPVQLRLGPNDVLYLHFSRAPQIGAFSYLCGPKTDRSATNCGA